MTSTVSTAGGRKPAVEATAGGRKPAVEARTPETTSSTGARAKVDLGGNVVIDARKTIFTNTEKVRFQK